MEIFSNRMARSYLPELQSSLTSFPSEDSLFSSLKLDNTFQRVGALICTWVEGMGWGTDLPIWCCILIWVAEDVSAFNVAVVTYSPQECNTKATTMPSPQWVPNPIASARCLPSSPRSSPPGRTTDRKWSALGRGSSRTCLHLDTARATSSLVSALNQICGTRYKQKSTAQVLYWPVAVFYWPVPVFIGQSQFFLVPNDKHA